MPAEFNANAVVVVKKAIPLGGGKEIKVGETFNWKERGTPESRVASLFRTGFLMHPDVAQPRTVRKKAARDAAVAKPARPTLKTSHRKPAKAATKTAPAPKKGTKKKR